MVGEMLRKIAMMLLFFYAVWVLFQAVDAHVTAQMNLWKNLGM